MIGATRLSPVTKLVAGSGAVLSRRSGAESGVAVQTISEPDNSQGVGFIFRADARFAHRSGAKVGVRVQLQLQICHRCRSKSKNCDELINYTVRVISRVLFIPLFKTYSRSRFAVLF